MAKFFQQVHLDPELIRMHMDRLGWDQLRLFTEAEISPKALTSVLTHEKPCKASTALKIARALNVEVNAIALGFLSDWQTVPELQDKRLTAKLKRAVALDMKGEHAKAAQIVEEVLAALSPQRDPTPYAFVCMKWVSTLDNMGEHQRVIDLIEQLLEGPARDCDHAQLWAAYRLGISKRRLGCFSEARRDLESLREFTNPFSMAALHQLAVIDIQEAKQSEGTERKKFLDDAQFRLEQALEEQKAFGQTHRRAFSLHRLGEVAKLRGDYDEAFRYLVEALTTYSWSHCERYRADATRDLERIVVRMKSEAVKAALGITN